MKLIDVDPVQSGLDSTIKDIENFYEQIGSVQRAVRDFHSLDGALDGKGGEAIRAFYRDCHEPFLIMLYQSMVDYKNVLTEMGEAVDTFESGENGYVSHSFLENEVEDALDNIETKAINYTDEANEIIDSVADLVSIPEINESDLVNHIQKAKSNTEELIGDLHELDGAQTAAIESTKETLNDMERYISELEQMFQDGDLSITEYSLKQVRGLEGFQRIMENVYGESDIIDVILNKLARGGPLSDFERDELYDFFQSEVLDDKKRDYIKDTAGHINEEDIDKLKDHLNNNVLHSKKSLEEEIMLVEAFLFTDRDGYDIGKVETDERYKLEAYLMMLKNYHSAIVNDDITELHAHSLEYKKAPNNVREHVLKGTLELKEGSEDTTDGFFDMSRAMGHSHFHDVEITYFTSTKSTALHDHLEKEKLIDKESTFTRDFIISKVFSSAVGAMTRGTSDGIISIAEHQAELKKIRDDITVREAKEIASFLKMEFSIIESDSSIVPYGESKEGTSPKTSELYVETNPTQSTYKVFDRWKEIHNFNNEIPYPKDAIQSEDWGEISEFLKEEDIHPVLLEYIDEGTPPNKDGEELKPEELAKDYHEYE